MARMLLLKSIGELSGEETEALLSNEDVQKMILDYGYECEADFQREALDLVRESLSSWSIGAYDYNNHITVDARHLGAFIDGAVKIQENLSFLYNHRHALYALEALYNEYATEYEVGSERFRELEALITEQAQEVADALLSEFVEDLEYFTDYENLDGSTAENWLYNFAHLEVAVQASGVTLVSY